MKKDIEIVRDSLIDLGLSNSTAMKIINLLNYSHTKKLPLNEKKRWIKLDVLNKNGKIICGENESDDLSIESLFLFGMIWDGKIYREFDNDEQVFKYDSTRKGDLIAEVPVDRYESNILKLLAFGNDIESISKELKISTKRVVEELKVLQKKGFVTKVN